jgi:Fe-S-cluster containining protein
MPVKATQSETETENPCQPGCHSCNGLCCRHIATEIDRPTTKIDFDNIRWYLMHEDDNWMIEVTTPCRHLQSDHCCGIYANRPSVCREYPGTDESCEHEDKSPTYKLLFTNDNELVNWMETSRPAWKFGR